MKKPQKGIVVDGSTRGNPGPSEYRGVDLETGEILFNVKIGVATNNIAEFIGLGHAILHAYDNGHGTVYSDSQTAISWVKRKKSNSALPVNDKTKKAREYTERVEGKLRQLEIEHDGIDLIVEKKIRVEKWYTSEYGEIPADFGLKNKY